MAEPVAELDALLSLELDKSSFNKLNNQMKELRASIKSTMSGGVTKEPLAQSLQATTQQYKKTITQIKKAFGANDRQARAIMSSGLGEDKSSLSYKLAQMSNKKATKSKNWTLRELAAKEDDYQFYKKMFSGKGYSGGQMIAKLNKELGPNFIQTRGKRKAELEEYLLMKKENKERKKSLNLYKGLKNVGKLVGVGTVGAIVKKVITSAIKAGGSKQTSLYRYGGNAYSALDKAFGAIGGVFSNDEAREAARAVTGHIEHKTQTLPSIGEDIRSMAIATMGRGTDFIQRYVQLIAEGAQTGRPQTLAISKLADEVAASGLSEADKSALMRGMLGSDKAVDMIMENSKIEGKKNFTKQINKYAPTSNAGVTEANVWTRLKNWWNRTELDIGTELNKGSERYHNAREAQEAVDKEMSAEEQFLNPQKAMALKEKKMNEGLKRRAGINALENSKEERERQKQIAQMGAFGMGGGFIPGGDIFNITNNLYGNPSQEQVNAAGKLTKDETKNVNTKNMQKGGAW